jgi:MFS family permease
VSGGLRLDEDRASDDGVGPVPARTLLRKREFRGLVLAQVLSDWGDFVARVALAALVLDRSESALLAATVFAISFVPAVAGSAVLGALVDRLPRREVLLVGDAARGVLVGVLALLAVDGTPLWVLLAILFLSEIFTAPFESARQAMLPDVLPEPREYLAGNALLRVVFQADQVIGFVLGGIVVALVGARTALALDAVTFLVSFLAVLLLVRARPAPPRTPGQGVGLVAELREGWAAVFARPAVRTLVVLGWVAAVFISVPEAVALSYARADGTGAAAGGLLLASLPAGAALGAWLVTRLPEPRQVRLLLPLAAGACLPLLAAAVAPPWHVVLPLWFLSGACQGLMVPLITTVNLVTPAGLRGRVNGLAAAGFAASSAAALLLGGYVADLTSPATAVTVAGLAGVLALGLLRRSWPTREIDGVIEQAYGRVA